MDRIKIAIGILVVAILLFVGYLYFSKNISFLSPSTITIKNHTFTVTVAKSDTEKEIGLSNRNSLALNQGMYFPFSQSEYYGFWMKGMKFPIDIIYLNNNRVVTIYSNVPAPKNSSQPLPVYKPKQPANAVLEINGGLAHQYNIQEGDQAKISL